jgi:hypothetical protein
VELIGTVLGSCRIFIFYNCDFYSMKTGRTAVFATPL